MVQTTRTFVQIYILEVLFASIGTYDYMHVEQKANHMFLVPFYNILTS